MLSTKRGGVGYLGLFLEQHKYLDGVGSVYDEDGLVQLVLLQSVVLARRVENCRCCVRFRFCQPLFLCASYFWLVLPNYDEFMLQVDRILGANLSMQPPGDGARHPLMKGRNEYYQRV